MGRFIIGDAARLQALYGSPAIWLDGHGIAVAGLWAEHVNVSRLIQLAQVFTSWLNTAITFSVAVLVYVLLGLLEVDDASRKLRTWRHGDLGEILLVGGARTAAKFRQYMLVRTLMSAMTGALVFDSGAMSVRGTGLPGAGAQRQSSPGASIFDCNSRLCYRT
ncbi:MAG: hypothetical protein ABSG76_10295 [Xanthobacteraceae bacterium]